MSYAQNDDVFLSHHKQCTMRGTSSQPEGKLPDDERPQAILGSSTKSCGISLQLQ